jgi:hypothetical protein
LFGGRPSNTCSFGKICCISKSVEMIFKKAAEITLALF